MTTRSWDDTGSCESGRGRAGRRSDGMIAVSCLCAVVSKLTAIVLSLMLLRGSANWLFEAPP